jgi:glucose-1-phosphate thymidylyltransferase
MKDNSEIRGLSWRGTRRAFIGDKSHFQAAPPIYDKPMIYYPISVLMLAGIREIMIISTPADLPNYRRLLGAGEDLGLEFHYAEQPHPEGLAQAFIIAKEFISGHPSCLILGDNVFYGDSLGETLRRLGNLDTGATILAYWVKDPERYGVVVFDRAGRVVDLVEKPRTPLSNWAVRLYFMMSMFTTTPLQSLHLVAN